MKENEFYAERMDLWFKEQNRIRSQIDEDSVTPGANRANLTSYDERIAIMKKEYNAWAKDNDMPELFDNEGNLIQPLSEKTFEMSKEKC